MGNNETPSTNVVDELQWRKKPVTIEAFQFTGGPDQKHDPVWIVDAIKAGEVWCQGGESPYLTIKTLEGEMRAKEGDWIIRGVKGEIYPCKPDIFAATYEPARTPAQPTVDTREEGECCPDSNCNGELPPCSEPQAYQCLLAASRNHKTGEYDDFRYSLTQYKPNVPEGSIRDLQPLYLKAALSRPASPVAGAPALVGWQPIESAPKDGTDILLGGFVHECWEVMRDNFYQDRVMGDWREWPGCFDEPPTHWQPLQIPGQSAASPSPAPVSVAPEGDVLDKCLWLLRKIVMNKSGTGVYEFHFKDDADPIPDLIKYVERALASLPQAPVASREDVERKLQETLRLLWFWLPEHEPDPHSKSKAIIERNKRWHRACELYHEEFAK